MRGKLLIIGFGPGSFEHITKRAREAIQENSTTMIYEGLMITPRGYQQKYTLNTDVQRLRPHQRLQSDAEPWALEQWEECACGPACC